MSKNANTDANISSHTHTNTTWNKIHTHFNTGKPKSGCKAPSLNSSGQFRLIPTKPQILTLAMPKPSIKPKILKPFACSLDSKLSRPQPFNLSLLQLSSTAFSKPKPFTLEHPPAAGLAHQTLLVSGTQVKGNCCTRNLVKIVELELRLTNVPS